MSTTHRNLTVKQERLFRRFISEAKKEGLKIYQATEQAIQLWLKEKERENERQ